MVHTHYHPPPLMKGFLSGETRGYDETPQKRQDNKQTFPRKWCPFFSPLFAGMFYTLAKGRSPGTLRALRQPAPTWVRTWPPWNLQQVSTPRARRGQCGREGRRTNERVLGGR